LAISHLGLLILDLFNLQSKICNPLSQGRFKAILVDKESHLLELCRYVVLNPVRARVVEEAKGWPRSSYLSTVGLKPVPGYLSVDWILGPFSAERDGAKEISGVRRRGNAGCVTVG